MVTRSQILKHHRRLYICMWTGIGVNCSVLLLRLVLLVLRMRAEMPREKSQLVRMSDIAIGPTGAIVSTVISIATIIVIVLIVMPRHRRLYRAAKAQCPACGYPRSGRSRRAPCPECGDSPALRKRPKTNSS